MWRDAVWELVKLKGQKKNYIVLVGHATMMLLVGMGLSREKFRGPLAHAVGRLGLNLKDFADGLFFARWVYVPTLVMILPIFICTLAGDMIAGEVQDGSMRLYASRPRTRQQIVLSKFLAMCVAAASYCFYFAVVSLGVGMLLFGSPGTQVVAVFGPGVQADFSLMGPEETLWRYLLCTGYHVFSILALGSITLFFSTIFNRMTSATIAGLTAYFVSYMLEELPWLQEMKPYLLSRVMNGSIHLWMAVIPPGNVLRSFVVLSVYIALFLGLAITLFNAKDI